MPVKYEKYLLSPQWRRIRDGALRRAHFRCHRCASGSRLQVHHLTYDRLGHERDEDLEVLCKACHEGHHAEEDRRTKAPLPLYVKLVYEALHGTPFTSIADLAEDVKRSCVSLNIPYHPMSVAKAIYQASPALPVASFFHSPVPVSLLNETPLALKRELAKTEAVEILQQVQERVKRQFVLKTVPTIDPRPCEPADLMARANDIRRKALAMLREDTA